MATRRGKSSARGGSARCSPAQAKTILIPGYPAATLEAQAAGIPAGQFLAKPFTLGQLTAAISAALGHADPDGVVPPDEDDAG